MAKFGVREICDVVLKAKATTKIGNRTFYKNEPVIYFDTLKTSSMEGAATTVYAQGGAGNSRLVAWEGERTVTFTMEDALISPEGFMILSGAGLVEASSDNKIYQHVTETVDAGSIKYDADVSAVIPLSNAAYLPGNKGENFAYVMFMKDGEIISEPFIPEHGAGEGDDNYNGKKSVTVFSAVTNSSKPGGTGQVHAAGSTKPTHDYDATLPAKGTFDAVLVDYYVEKTGGAQQIEITADKFGGNYYLEASTLFRTTDGVDMPAEFIIPNCKIQSNFTFTMASTGDPSTFSFTLDAFPDYTRFDHTKKVLATIQTINAEAASDDHREKTPNA